MAKKKYYPSQEQYQAKNPSMSFRLPKEELEKLQKIAKIEGKTIGQYVRDFPREVVDEKKGYYKGFDDGFEEGKEKWLQYDCSVCRGRHVILPNNPVYREIIRSLHNQRICILQG